MSEKLSSLQNDFSIQERQEPPKVIYPLENGDSERVSLNTDSESNAGSTENAAKVPDAHHWQSSWELTPKEIEKKEKQRKKAKRKLKRSEIAKGFEDLLGLGVSGSSKHAHKRSSPAAAPSVEIRLNGNHMEAVANSDKDKMAKKRKSRSVMNIYSSTAKEEYSDLSSEMASASSAGNRSPIPEPKRIEVPSNPPGRTLLDMVADMEVDKLYEHIFENQSFWENVTKKRYDKLTSYKITPWEADENGVAARKLNYVFNQTIAWSTGTINVEQLQRKSATVGGQMYTVENLVRNSGPIYSDCFELRIHFRLTRGDLIDSSNEVNASKARFQVFCDLVFVKSCLFKSKVESETWNGMEKYYDVVKQEISRIARGGGSKRASQPQAGATLESDDGDEGDEASVRKSRKTYRAPPPPPPIVNSNLMLLALLALLFMGIVMTMAVYRLVSSIEVLNVRIEALERSLSIDTKAENCADGLPQQL